MKTRIIERKHGKNREYVIQQKHYIFRWMWVDAWVNSIYGAACNDTFSDFQEAVANLYLFDGSKPKDTVILESK